MCTAIVSNSIKSQLRKKSVEIISNHDRVAELSGQKKSQRLRQEVNCFWFRSRNHCLTFVFPQLCQSIRFSGKTRPQSHPGADICDTFAIFITDSFSSLSAGSFVNSAFGRLLRCRVLDVKNLENLLFARVDEICNSVSESDFTFTSSLLCLSRFAEDG